MKSIAQEKSYSFALEIIVLYKKLTTTNKEYVLSKQLLRSGTSIGANVEEALGGQSKKDFQHKMALAYKESRETSYWLRLLHDSSLISTQDFTTLHSQVDELLRILGTIQQTLKSQL